MLVIGLLFALPAARAGYDATLGLAHIGVPSGWWREAFGILGAIIIGCTAWARVSILTGTAPGEGATLDPAQSPIGGSDHERVRPQAPSSPGWDQRGDPAVTMTAISRFPAHFD